MTEQQLKLDVFDAPWTPMAKPIDIKFIGKLIEELNEAGSAASLDILADVIPMAAVYEVGSLRKDNSYTHGLSSRSDILDGVHAYVKAFDIQNAPNLSRTDRVEQMDACNVSMRRYIDASFIIKTLEQRLKTISRFECYRDRIVENYDRRMAEIRQCILAASVCNMGSQTHGSRDQVFTPAGSAFDVYVVSKGSASSYVYEKTIVSAKLRVITARKTGISFTVAENITQFEPDDIREFNSIRPGVFSRQVREDGEYFFVFGVMFYYVKSNISHFGSTTYASRSNEDSGTSLGSILTDALRKKADGGSR